MLDLLNSEIEKHSSGISRSLAPFNGVEATDAWFEVLRATEEFINLPLFGLNDPALEAALLKLPVAAVLEKPRHIRVVRHLLAYEYGEAFAQRFVRLLIQSASIASTFAQHGLSEPWCGLRTVADAIGYFQSRRRHMVSLLYTMPSACRGSHPVPLIDAVNLFFPIIEMSGIAVIGLYQQIMLANVFEDYAVVIDGSGFMGAREYPALDRMFLEPERAAIIDMQLPLQNPDVLEKLETVPQGRLFSSVELRNNITIIETAYSEFDLENSEFRTAASFIREVSKRTVDEYWVNLTHEEFVELADAIGLTPQFRTLLTHIGSDYVENTNLYTPFLSIDGRYRSTVTLLGRFLYYWKNVCLNRNRRFQIRSGFIFEDTVKSIMDEHGFTITKIKRLNRKEFDVVAIRDGVIFNVQCKNNLIDLARLEADPLRFARYNKKFERSYERALKKEQNREHLLIQALGYKRVEHVVLSRFPVATDNPRILSFSRVADLDDLARRLIDGKVS